MDLDPKLEANFEVFNIHTNIIKDSLRRDKLYRLNELNRKVGCLTEQQRKLLSHIISKTKSNPVIHQNNILLMDAVNYPLHFPCLLAQEDGHWGATFADPSLGGYLYIFDTQELLKNLVLDGFPLPKIFQNLLGIRQKIESWEHEQKDHLIRDAVVQTIAHVLFSIQNEQFRWNQVKMADHVMVRFFGISQCLQNNGDKRVLRDAIKKIIPKDCRKRGNPDRILWTQEELKKSPLTIPEAITVDKHGNVKVDFHIIKSVMRAALFIKRILTPIEGSVSKSDYLSLPVIEQIFSNLSPSEKAIFDYELHRFASKFGHLKMSST